MFEKGIHNKIDELEKKQDTTHSNSKKNFRLFDETRANSVKLSNSKKNFRLFDETQANSVRGKEGTKSPNQKSKTQELF